jgi:DNA-binding winged helix-turn-helix (wHTH) protein
MRRRTRWVLGSLVGLALLIAVAVAILWTVGRYRAGVEEALRISCAARVAAFEQFAEEWIVRGDVRALETAADLLVMGSSLYVDVVAHGEVLVTRTRQSFGREPVDLAASPPERTVVDRLPGGDVEVRAPIEFAGYPGTPVGFLRIGFSGEYAREQVRSYAATACAVGVGSWAAALLVLGAILAGRRLRPTLGRSDSIVCCDGLEIDTRTCEAKLDGERLDLTPKLYDLLLVFARSPGTVFSDGDLLRSVWPDSQYAGSADVKQHIYLLRRKLGDVHPNPKTVIETVKGFGYRLSSSANERELNEG